MRDRTPADQPRSHAGRSSRQPRRSVGRHADVLYSGRLIDNVCHAYNDPSCRYLARRTAAQTGVGLTNPFGNNPNVGHRDCPRCWSRPRTTSPASSRGETVTVFLYAVLLSAERRAAITFVAARSRGTLLLRESGPACVLLADMLELSNVDMHVSKWRRRTRTRKGGASNSSPL
jgi:hypothetical protein